MGSSDLERVLDLINSTIGRDQTKWPPYPGGYPDEAEAALLDSVFSLQAVYGLSQQKGARRVINNWRTHTGRILNSLDLLVRDVDDLSGGPDEFRQVLGNNQVAVPRAPDKPSKALAVYTSAKALVAIGITNADEIRLARTDRPKELETAIRTARGVGLEATTYFLMNLGVAGVKADTMIQGFVKEALGRRVSPSDARLLIEHAAEELQADLLSLDHAIWDYWSSSSRKGRSG